MLKDSKWNTNIPKSIVRPKESQTIGSDAVGDDGFLAHQKTPAAAPAIVMRAGTNFIQIPSRAMRPIRLRVSPTMADAIKTESIKTGLSESAWMRSAIAQYLDMTDPADLQPVRAYGSVGPDAAAMNALRMQLHELGGLLTQVAKVSRLIGDSSLHANAEATLADVREAIATVAGWQEEKRRAG